MDSDGGCFFEPFNAPPTLSGPYWGWYESNLLVTSSAGVVSSWGDGSGNGNTLSQATSGDRMTITANFQNGYPAITGTATQWMATTSGMALGGTASYLLVGQWTSGASGTSDIVADGVSNFLAMGSNTTPEIQLYNGNSVPVVAGDLSAGVTYVMSCVFNNASSHIKFGQTAGTFGGTTQTFNLGGAGSNAAGFKINALSSTSNRGMPCKWLAAYVVNYAFSAGDETALISYVKVKFGIG